MIALEEDGWMDGRTDRKVDNQSDGKMCGFYTLQSLNGFNSST